MPKPTLSCSRKLALCALVAAALASSGCATVPAIAQTRAAPPAPALAAEPTYVDLVELAQAADVVVRLAVDEQITVPPDRAPGIAPGEARLYVEALTQALLGGRGVVGESLRFLVDVPVNAKGKPVDIEKAVFIAFADLVPGRPGEMILVAPQAMQPATPELETRVREVLTQLAAPERPPQIEGVREVMSVAGNLAGESETQIFLATADGTPVSLSVVRRPGMRPEWGVSWSEIVDQAARAPAPGTLDWYALACFLPRELPASAFLQNEASARAQAREDYALILAGIGACSRNF